MSERQGEPFPLPEESEARSDLYQCAAFELLTTCVEHLRECGDGEESSGDIWGSYYLDPPASYELPEWDWIDVEIFRNNSTDKKGSSKMARIELVQDVGPALMLVERYDLLHDGTNLKLVRRFRHNYSLGEKKGYEERNSSPEQIVTKDEISHLTELIFMSKVDK